VRYEVMANWKLCVENFQESHHFRRVHPALERLTPSAGASTWQSSQEGTGAWLGGLMELAPGATTVAVQGEPGVRARPSIVPPEQRRRVADALAFPVLLTSLQPDYLLTYHLAPRGPSRTGVVAKTYFHAGAFSPALEAEDVFRFWDRVNAEDRAICERQQQGVGSRAFDAATYSLVEEGVLAFDQRVARVYLEAVNCKAPA
jgi:Rieske 2Fe-2S family protein